MSSRGTRSKSKLDTQTSQIGNFQFQMRKLASMYKVALNLGKHVIMTHSCIHIHTHMHAGNTQTNMTTEKLPEDLAILYFGRYPKECK